ncbi:hypothetical protein PRIC2_006444 [Phytophthora ramorum]
MRSHVLQELAAENNSLAVTNSSLESRTTGLLDHADRLHAELARAHSSLRDLHDQVEQARSTSVSSSQEADRLISERDALQIELCQVRQSLQSVGKQLAEVQSASDLVYQDVSSELQAAQDRIRDLRSELRTARQSFLAPEQPQYLALPSPAAEPSSSNVVSGELDTDRQLASVGGETATTFTSSPPVNLQLTSLQLELTRALDSDRRAHEASRSVTERREQAEENLVVAEQEIRRLRGALSMATMRGDAY